MDKPRRTTRPKKKPPAPPEQPAEPSPSAKSKEKKEKKEKKKKAKEETDEKEERDETEETDERDETEETDEKDETEETGEKGGEGGEEPPVWLWINLVLLLFILMEAGLIGLARPIWATGLIEIVSLLSTIWKMTAGVVFGLVLGLLVAERKKLEAKLRPVLQKRNLTFWLAGVALLFMVPGVSAARWLRDPPPLLRVLPAAGIYNGVSMAEEVKDTKGPSFRYVFKVERNGRSLLEAKEMVVTGAASIYVGQDPKRQMAIFKNELANQIPELEAYTERPEVRERWMNPALSKLVKASIQEGCVELVLGYWADRNYTEITRQRVPVKSKAGSPVFLEKRNETCEP